jgi:hypothetical protein
MTLPMTDGAAAQRRSAATCDLCQVHVGDRLQVWVSELRNTSLILASDPKKARHSKTWQDMARPSQTHFFNYRNSSFLVPHDGNFDDCKLFMFVCNCLDYWLA